MSEQLAARTPRPGDYLDKIIEYVRADLDPKDFTSGKALLKAAKRQARSTTARLFNEGGAIAFNDVGAVVAIVDDVAELEEVEGIVSSVSFEGVKGTSGVGIFDMKKTGFSFPRSSRGAGRWRKKKWRG